MTASTTWRFEVDGVRYPPVKGWATTTGALLEALRNIDPQRLHPAWHFGTTVDDHHASVELKDGQTLQLTRTGAHQ